MKQRPKNMWLIFSHALTEDQVKDARDEWGVAEFRSLPPDLQQAWSNIPPDPEGVAGISGLLWYLSEVVRPDDVVLVQGDYGATYHVVRAVTEMGAIPVYATTRRVVAEEKGEDGAVAKKTIFKHVRFRRY